VKVATKAIAIGLAKNTADIALRESERRYTSLFGSALNIFYVHDFEGRILDANQAALDALGYTKDDFGKINFADLMSEEDAATARKRTMDLLEKGSVVGTEEYLLTGKDGKQVWVEADGAILYKDGKPYAMHGFARDITERKRGEEALKESESRYRSLFDRSPNWVFVYDFDGRILDANKAVLDAIGFGPEELGEISLADFFDPEQLAIAGDRMKYIIENGASKTFQEYRFRDKSGRMLWIEAEGSLLLRDGKPYAIHGIARDITERKLADKRLRRAFEEIQTLKEQLEAENVYLREEIESTRVHSNIVARSDEMKRVLETAEQVAVTSSTVLLQGETGTGKELLARAIHDMSPRKDKPMVAVNCAAMPSTLVENELFGREKGAYTGALTKQMGRFELANNSTIFLDEVGELSPEIQGKLLRVLQEGTFERLGSSVTITVDVRVIAATNRDLAVEVEEGRFREDLYYRLNVFPITIPPLREHPDDIPPLTWAFIKELGERMGKRIESIPRPSMEGLQSYAWPGNIRELRNVVERAMILSTGTALRAEVPRGPSRRKAATKTLQDIEKEHILSVLEKAEWRVRGEGGAAEILGLKPTTLESRIKKLRIQRDT
jgi:PAS domain S-box-containing protein